MSEYKETHALRFVVDTTALLCHLPIDVLDKCHVLFGPRSHVVDIVSDEPFEVLGQKSRVTRKGNELCNVALPIDYERKPE